LFSEKEENKSVFNSPGNISFRNAKCLPKKQAQEKEDFF